MSFSPPPAGMPSSSYPPEDRVLGCLVGGAVGTALGMPVEGVSLEEIRRRHGPTGLTDYVDGRAPAGAIAGDAQLMLLTAQALVQSSVRARSRGIGGATLGLLQVAYLSWLRGQGETIPDQGWPGGGWLLSDPAMTARRSPGRTLLAALHKAAERRKPGWPLGTVDEPINDSKGCGGVTRTAPCGFGTPTAQAAFALGRDAAALTHGHPSGHLPGGVLAATVWGLLRGQPLPDALAVARGELAGQRGHEETARALDAATALAGQGEPTPEKVESLGAGWTGEEALAIGVYAALAAERWARTDGPGGRAALGGLGLLVAVNHSGDSDSTALICGNLLGAAHGAEAFPRPWRDRLEVADAVARLAADCALEFGPNPPAEPGTGGAPPLPWAFRYPEG
ncbi:ADP-ribosylglycohydrolase family protein [Actinomadura gamaensis]|uniref:ADP-ribosylglycohydrolase family protein n=1 Tax=Actinomadura gamaensis TaxID=1763541 RepID=A0ABV9TVA2_9ACTN